MNPEDFWKPFEVVVSSFDELYKAIGEICAKRAHREMAWRGQANASWALHSSLYRSILRASTSKKSHDEKTLHAYEANVLAEFHRWGLHMSHSGRLSILNQLAALQHYGSPTRLIDITFNPLIGAWFAVEDPAHANQDARLFAIDITDRLINENQDLRYWEDELTRPWSPVTDDEPEDKSKEARRKLEAVWNLRTYAWRPPHFDRRIAAQNGGFVFGGVPHTSLIPTTPSGNKRWKIAEVRESTSIALRPHLLEKTAGKDPLEPVYTIRIVATEKEKIKSQLKQYGYDYRTLYPDLPGFASFGVTIGPKPIAKVVKTS